MLSMLIMARFAKKFDVKIINQEGKGKTGAIATAIKHIKTPYFALIDGEVKFEVKDRGRTKVSVYPIN